MSRLLVKRAKPTDTLWGHPGAEIMGHFRPTPPSLVHPLINAVQQSCCRLSVTESRFISAPSQTASRFIGELACLLLTLPAVRVELYQASWPRSLPLSHFSPRPVLSTHAIRHLAFLSQSPALSRSSRSSRTRLIFCYTCSLQSIGCLVDDCPDRPSHADLYLPSHHAHAGSST